MRWAHFFYHWHGYTHLLEIFYFDTFIIQKHFDIFDCARHVIDTFHQKSVGIVINPIHTKSFEIWFECDFGPFLAFFVLEDLKQQSANYYQDIIGLLYLGSALLAHIIWEDLLILFAVDLVGSLDDYITISSERFSKHNNERTELMRIDVGQLGTVTVSTAGELFLVVIKITSCQSAMETVEWSIYVGNLGTHKWPKINSGIMTPSLVCISTGIPRPLLYTDIVFFSRSITTLIESMVASLIYRSGWVAIRFNNTHCIYLIIRGIHQDLIKDFKKTRDKCDGSKAV